MFVSGIGIAVPRQRYTQEECWHAVRRAPQFGSLAPRSRATLQAVLFNGESGIRSRHLALDRLEDVFACDPDTLSARYARHAPALAAEAARAALDDAGVSAHEVDAVLVSTCTGYLCPGLSGYVAERLGLRAAVLGLDLVGQGCGAAVPNLRAAEALVASRRCATVLSVCVEVCSAAFFIDDDSGVLISACIFGDGAGALVLTGKPREEKRRVEWKGAWSSHDPGNRDVLRFRQSGGRLRNVLTPQVPAMAGEQAADLLRAALREKDMQRSQITNWIWHGGGKRVLERLCASVELQGADVERSARVLSEFGNVSSPFVYFVLALALKERAPDGWWWLSSFGAGFSCHGALLAVSS